MRFIDRLFKGRKPRRLDKLAGALLNLSFTANKPLDPRITFSRTTNATLTNSAGLIANAPMNLLTHSEQVDNAAWTKANATITANSEVSPDGSTTADKLVENTANATHNLGVFTAPSFASGVTYTYSLYLKAGERFRGLFTLATASTAFGSVVSANFNLQAKTITAASGSPTVSIEELSNGWFRLTISKTAVATVSEGGLGLRLANDAGATTYTGDGVSGLFIWGAQLELGSTATTYNPTTVKNLLGFTENFDNAAWTKTNAFVQTNLLTNSVFANTGGAAPTGYSQSFGTGVSAPSGTASNGDVIYTQTAAAERPFFVQGLTSVVGITYTNSMTVTAASGLTVAQVIGASGVTSTYTLNGVSVLGSTLVTPGVLASTWTATATNNVPRFGIGITGNATGSISFHSAQVVQGTTPGDYKATYAAAAAVGYTDIYGQPFAQKLVESTANSTHTVAVALTPTAATPYTGTVYVKAAERQFAFVGLGQTGNNNFASINLSTGVVSVALGSPTVSSTPLGNGWFRVSVTATSISTNSLNLDIRVSTDGVWDNRSYTGDGTSGIYIFGAQLSDSASVDPYVYQPVAAPTSTAYYGPRFDYDASTATITENYGPELITNGDFSNGATGWILNPTGSNVITISGGAVRFQATGADTATLSQTGVTTAGKFYKVEFDVLAGSSGQLKVLPFGTSGEIVFSCTPGRKTFGTTVATSTSFQISRVVGQVADAYIDNITVTEYLGITSTGAAPKGLLIEEQRTNLLTYSEQFDNAAWIKINSTVSANAIVSPDGTVDAEKLIEDTTAAYHGATFTFSWVSGTTYTASVFVKAAGRGFFQIAFPGSQFSNAYANFDVSTGVLGSSNSVTATIASVGNGWYRCTATATATSSAATAVGFGSQTSGTATRFNSYTGDGFSGIYIWGAQLEAGAFATSYIPTVASQVTRAADSASMIGNNFTRWYNQTEGTLFAQYSVNGLNPSGANVAYGITDGTTANFIVDRTQDNQLTNFRVRVGGVDQASLFSTAVAAGVVAKSAGSYALNNFAFTTNAGAVQTDTAGTLPVVTQMQIGGLSSSLNPLNGTISRIAYYNRRLANTELQAITS